MTNTLKRIVALLLGVILTVSLCSMAFAAVDEATMAALGISGMNSTSVVDSPDGSGEKVIAYSATGVRPNVELAYDWVEGTTYTMKIQYWLAKEHTGGSFQLYYGEAPSKSGKTASTSFSINNSYIGDGQWHTKYVQFTYSVPASKPANTNLYLTFYSAGTFKIYVKGITISPESRGNTVGNFDLFKNEDGTPKTGFTGFTNGSSGLLNLNTVAADGSVIFTPSSNGSCQNLTDDYTGSIQYVKVQNVTSSGTYKVSLIPGNKYTVVIKYKLLALGSANKGGFGVGYLVESTDTLEGSTSTGWRSVKMVDSVVLTETTDDYNTFICTFDYENEANADLVLAIPYKPQKLAVAETTVVRVTKDATMISTVTYNDNGEYGAYADYVGEPITIKGKNGYLGEECKGWADNPALTGDNVTAVPENDVTLYAKYDTIVIDNFNMQYGMRNGYDTYNASTASLSHGLKIKFNTTTVGFMIPAYDYIGDNDGVSGNYEWYTFTKGQKYSVALDVKNLTTGEKGNVFAVTAATGAGSGGKRSTSNQADMYRVLANTNADEVQFGTTFTCKFADGYNNAIIRGTSENATMTANIERIIITKVSDEPIAKLVAVSKRDASETKTAGVRFKATVSQPTLANATEAGFVVVPADVLGGKTVQEYIEAGGIPAARCVNYNAAEDTNIVYGGYTSNYTVAASYDYQVVLTGLTSLTDDTLDLRGLDFTVAFFVTTAEGTVYHDSYTTSYNTIAGMQ